MSKAGGGNTVPNLVTSDKVVQALIDAGVISGRDRIHRVIIDLQAQHPPLIYIEKYGDERLLGALLPKDMLITIPEGST